MELVLPMYNAHPYFSLKNLGKKTRTVYTAKHYILLFLVQRGRHCYKWIFPL